MGRHRFYKAKRPVGIGTKEIISNKKIRSYMKLKTYMSRYIDNIAVHLNYKRLLTYIHKGIL